MSAAAGSRQHSNCMGQRSATEYCMLCCSLKRDVPNAHSLPPCCRQLAERRPKLRRSIVGVYIANEENSKVCVLGVRLQVCVLGVGRQVDALGVHCQRGEQHGVY